MSVDAGCSTSDCTLREAIVAANGQAGANTIEFDIADEPTHIITPQTALPTITEEVTIDGTTEPDYAGIPVVELNGTVVSAGDGPWHGLRPPGTTASSAAWRSTASRSWARASASRCRGDRNSVESNAIGTDPSGAVARPNGNGIEIFGGATENTIGGSAATPTSSPGTTAEV